MSSPQAKTGVEVERLIGEIQKALKDCPAGEVFFPAWWSERQHDLWSQVNSGHGMHRSMVADCVPHRFASLIAACNPENIRQLLAALAAERAEAVRMREENEKLREALSDARTYVEASSLNASGPKTRQNYRGCLARIDATLNPKEKHV